MDSPKTRFWTTVFAHDAFSAPLARSDKTSIDFTLARAYALGEPRGAQSTLCEPLRWF